MPLCSVPFCRYCECRYAKHHSAQSFYVECPYAEHFNAYCYSAEYWLRVISMILIIVNIIMISVILLSVLKPSVLMLNNGHSVEFWLSAVMPSVARPNVAAPRKNSSKITR